MKKLQHIIEIQNLGKIGYQKAWDLQEKLFDSIVNDKLSNRELPEERQKLTKNYLLICEHPHVYTLGKSGSEQNLLINQIQLKANDAEFFHINRGGDITYHGPGQIVAYPILNLEYFTTGVKDYINKLEEAVIEMLKHYNIESTRLKESTGVWLDTDIPEKTRKICAIGVRSSRWVSMHGLALNINTNLEYFNHINPCGFTNKKVTSVAAETGSEVNFDLAIDYLIEAFSKVFDAKITK